LIKSNLRETGSIVAVFFWLQESQHEVVMRKFLLVFILMSVASLTGCETMEGFGKDIKNLGDKIEKKASSTE
jgi:predicted small secreted protein